MHTSGTASGGRPSDDPRDRDVRVKVDRAACAPQCRDVMSPNVNLDVDLNLNLKLDRNWNGNLNRDR